jgi:glycine/D-amino acid oxidase-like deaminating enzyme
VTQDGVPLIGTIPGAPGGYVATGHSVRAILNAPATGKAGAELILDGVTRGINLSRFNPARFDVVDPARRQIQAPWLTKQYAGIMSFG